MSEHRYMHSNMKDEVELGRLRLQAGIYDPVTIRRLETIGVAEGWKCLEVGAGAGSVAQWLSQRVGPTGRVVATDIDTRFLQRMGAPNLEIRRHDILKDDLEKDEYDLVQCRLLLMHLPEPEKAVKRMADAVRPGGWLFIEDTDYGSTLSNDVTDPTGVLFSTTSRAFYDSLRKRGVLDPYVGRRLRSLVEQLGFVDIGQDGWTRMYRGGEPAMRNWIEAYELAGNLMIAAGCITQEELDRFPHAFSDPAFNWIGPIMFGAWGRRPVQVT